MARPLILSLLLIAFLLGGCRPTPSAEYTLSYASPYPPNHPFSRADIAWMQHVTAASKGRIQIRPFWAGSVISSEMSMLEIAHGIADIGLITPIYTRGGAHALRGQAGFYSGVTGIDEQVSVYRCLSRRFPVFSQELQGLQVLAVQGGNFPGVLTKERPVRKLEDFRGLRLRAPTETVNVLKRLGADPVNMPMSEVYSALAKGIIDGVVAPADTIHSLHFSEVANYFTTIRFPRGAYPARAMSSQVWQRLPPELKQLLAASRRVWEEALRLELEKAEAAGIAIGSRGGIEFFDIAAEEQARFDQIYKEAALQEARGLASLGIDGEAMFHTVENLLAAGRPIRCPQGELP